MQTFFDTYPVTIAANGIYTIHNYSSFVSIIESSTVTPVRVRIGPGGPRGTLEKGLSVELPKDDKFNKIIIENPTGVQITLTVALSSGRIYDNRVVLSGTLPVDNTANSIETPVALAVPASPAAAVNIPADADQKEIIIENTGAQIVWIGDASVAAATQRGLSIPVGDSKVLTTTAIIYLQSVAAGAGQVSYMRLKRV